ncbi:hypothetical protein Astex_2350 [Asticcacaulis excentricus CB 48]|uniref:Uncharacterized protein n=1 Tax=Asticcacaulis excentricus (strain ATCC 15261 / DSM 4724 / KCTC 12464 / NCIMB 9791 / VKM B-1370 / CB 48) TaxID=573065 RepID=E8RNA4_ASTEC|nr:hypothetical protein Astex_2350 [Asticcacaulis excentricus CB 48]
MSVSAPLAVFASVLRALTRKFGRQHWRTGLIFWLIYPKALVPDGLGYFAILLLIISIKGLSIGTLSPLPCSRR